MEQVEIEENLESVDYEGTENMEDNHPWNSLSTVTTFDEGKYVTSILMPCCFAPVSNNL